MATWSNATVTEKGYALQAKLLSTDSLVITRVISGSGRVTAGQLVKQTAVSEEKQALTVEALSYDNNGNAIIKTSLNNKNLTSGYTCNQIGIYASDPDEGEILYAIAQEATAGEDVPSITEQPNGYYCSWVFSLTYSNSSNVSVTIDPANALTKEAADTLYPSKQYTEENFVEINAKMPFYVHCEIQVTYDENDNEVVHFSPSVNSNEAAKAAYQGAPVFLRVFLQPFSEDEDPRGKGDIYPLLNYTYFPEYNNYFCTYGCFSDREMVIFKHSGTSITTESTFAAFGQYVAVENSILNNISSNKVIGNYNVVSGTGVRATNAQFVTGRYNVQKEGSLSEQSSDKSLFVIGYGTSDTARANAMRVSTAGKCYGASAFLGSGADFPEFEEWADGNPDNEDRRGRFAALEGDKIVLASSEKDHIIGVISVMGAFIANSASENWKGMYLKDVFGENLTQQVEIPEKTIEKKVFETDEEGNRVKKTITEVIPAHTVTQFVVNPDYNPDEEYIGREFRKEWAPVGKLGQVIVVDDGTCTVGGYCKPSANGIGTAGEYGYYVRKRIDSTHIKVEISPGAFNK